MNVRQRLLTGTDRLLAVVLATLLAGTVLAFGGAVWWAGPAIAALTALFVLGWLVHIVLEGKMRLLKSPLAALGVLGLGLAVVQLAPLPARYAEKLSPRSHQVYSMGYFPERARVLDPEIVLSEPAHVRSPVSIDRPATLRWLAGATACLALFWGVSHFTDRLQRLYLVWGSLVATFFVNTAIALVQLVGGTGGLYGFLEPGRGPIWAPSVNDLLNSPNATALRLGATGNPAHPAWASTIPDRPALIGTLMGGPGAYLAMASIVLPLALALLLQVLAPRGSRERLGARLAHSGQGGLVVLMAGMLVASTLVTGYLAGPLLCLPFALTLVLVGLPSSWPSGLRWSGIGMTALSLAGLGTGVALGVFAPDSFGTRPLFEAEGPRIALSVWADARAIARDFPILGSGLGSFASIYPFYKSRDEAYTTALSSLIQWWTESGAVGLALVGIGAAWCLWRIPGAIRRVGTADRALGFGLLGGLVGFSLYSTIHWTVELAAIAIAASALGGICNRWLAGGTDLFVERG